MSGLELAARLFLSCAGDGRSMHYHEMAMNALVEGRKRWAVTPPPSAHFSTQMGSIMFAELDTGAQDTTSTNRWTNADGAEAKARAPMQCMQQAGDIVIVPALWSHATLSVEACFAFATFLDFEPVRSTVPACEWCRQVSSPLMCSFRLLLPGVQPLG